MKAPLILIPDASCDKCGRPTLMFVVIEGKKHCARCWKRGGSVFPKYIETLEQQALREDAINRNALRQGGAAAHMVKSGKT